MEENKENGNNNSSLGGAAIRSRSSSSNYKTPVQPAKYKGPPSSAKGEIPFEEIKGVFTNRKKKKKEPGNLRTNYNNVVDYNTPPGPAQSTRAKRAATGRRLPKNSNTNNVRRQLNFTDVDNTLQEDGSIERTLPPPPSPRSRFHNVSVNFADSNQDMLDRVPAASSTTTTTTTTTTENESVGPDIVPRSSSSSGSVSLEEIQGDTSTKTDQQNQKRGVHFASTDPSGGSNQESLDPVPAANDKGRSSSLTTTTATTENAVIEPTVAPRGGNGGSGSGELEENQRVDQLVQPPRLNNTNSGQAEEAASSDLGSAVDQFVPRLQEVQVVEALQADQASQQQQLAELVEIQSSNIESLQKEIESLKDAKSKQNQRLDAIEKDREEMAIALKLSNQRRAALEKEAESLKKTILVLSKSLAAVETRVRAIEFAKGVEHEKDSQQQQQIQQLTEQFEILSSKYESLLKENISLKDEVSCEDESFRILEIAEFDSNLEEVLYKKKDNIAEKDPQDAELDLALAMAFQTSPYLEPWLGFQTAFQSFLVELVSLNVGTS